MTHTSFSVEMWAPGDHAIIDVHDFKSPKELAEYILKLNDNDELYNEYFAWKKQGLRPHFKELREECLFYAECRLCKKLADIRAQEKRSTRASAGPLKAFALQFNRMDQKLAWRGDDMACVSHHVALDLTTDYTLMAWISIR